MCVPAVMGVEVIVSVCTSGDGCGGDCEGDILCQRTSQYSQ